MNTSRLREKDIKYHWHPYTRYSQLNKKDFPIIERGDGLYLYDTEGNKYIDAISSWWADDLGHSRTELIDAIKSQVDTLQHTICGNMSHRPVIELSEKLVNLFDDTERHVIYGSDGASAVEAALKISLQYFYNIGHPEKNRFVALKNGYHGDTLGAISVGFVESFHKQFESFITPAFRAYNPLCSKCKYGQKEDTCSVECFESMEDIFNKHGKELAAVIVEPLCQGSSGMRIYSPKYLQKLEKLCKENKVLFITDEIAVGYGRTGKMFAHQHAGVNPDIVTVAKGLSNGYLPISAAIVKNKIFDTFKDDNSDNTLYHGHTFAGNPIACALAIKVLDIYEKENIVAKSEELGRVLKLELEKFKHLHIVDNIRTLGMIGAVELKDGVKIKNEDAPDYIKRAMLKKGIFVRPLGNVVYLMMPLTTPKDILKSVTSTLLTIFKEVQELGTGR